MGDFREGQDQAHPNKTNTLMGGIITLLIGILGIQVWLLYSALNNALDDNRGIAVAAFTRLIHFVCDGLVAVALCAPKPAGLFGRKSRREKTNMSSSSCMEASDTFCRNIKTKNSYIKRKICLSPHKPLECKHS
jgi:hypothetical protein